MPLTGALQPKEINVTNNNTAYTLGGTGSLAGPAALTKNGTGTLAINTANTYTRGTTINGGTVSLVTSTGLGAGIIALNGATLHPASAAFTFANELRLSGSSTFSGTSSYGGDTAVTAGTLGISGTLTSQGNLDVSSGATLRLTSGTGFDLNGSFTNTGLLDLLTAEVSPAVLGNIVNHGIILDSSMVKIASASKSNGFTVTIQSYTGHSYRLQRSATLINPDWADIITAQPGNGAILSFTDPTAAGSALSYTAAHDKLWKMPGVFHKT